MCRDSVVTFTCTSKLSLERSLWFCFVLIVQIICCFLCFTCVWNRRLVFRFICTVTLDHASNDKSSFLFYKPNMLQSVRAVKRLLYLIIYWQTLCRSIFATCTPAHRYTFVLCVSLWINTQSAGDCGKVRYRRNSTLPTFIKFWDAPSTAMSYLLRVLVLILPWTEWFAVVAVQRPIIDMTG